MKESLLIENETKKEIENNALNGTVKNLDEKLKRFIFHSDNGKKFEIFVKHIGSIDEIIDKINENLAEKKDIKDYKGLKLIVEAFRSYKQFFENRKGKEIEKAPHLLISGGFVRDVLTDKLPNDIDLVTNISLDSALDLIKKYQKLKALPYMENLQR